MRFVRLNISDDLGYDLEKYGAFYSNHLHDWFVNESQLSYPKKNLHEFETILTNDVFEATHPHELQSMLYDLLGKYFKVTKDIKGVGFDGVHRVMDLLITPRYTDGWKDQNVHMGILLTNNPDTVELTRWAKNVADHSYTKWGKRGRIPFFVSPGVFDICHQDMDTHSNLIEPVRQQLSHLKIGFCNAEQGFILEWATQRVWCHYYGVQNLGRSSNLNPNKTR